MDYPMRAGTRYVRYSILNSKKNYLKEFSRDLQEQEAEPPSGCGAEKGKCVTIDNIRMRIMMISPVS